MAVVVAVGETTTGPKAVWGRIGMKGIDSNVEARTGTEDVMTETRDERVIVR